MNSKRRKFLKIAGGGVILSATALGAFWVTRTPKKALEPWNLAGSYQEPRRRALSYAILAPNPHNRQPWEVGLDEEGVIVVWRDRARNLPETDPFDRQLTIGMGCFLELLGIAAGETGHRVETELFPEGEAGPVAVVRFHEGGERDPLFAHVLNRRSCKEAFQERPVPPDMVEALRVFADIHTEREKVATIKELTWKAWLTESTTHRTMKESVDLFRLGKTEINANPDGIDLGGPFLETLMLVGMLTREGTLDPNSTEFEQAKSIYQTMLLATPAYATVVTESNQRSDQILAGRRWLRLNLTATGLGLSLHPVSQALQEYQEMTPHYQAMHELVATSGQTVQMLGRLGFGPDVAPSPRWPLETRIKHG